MRPWSRRRLIQKAGLGLLSWPLAKVLLEERAEAASPQQRAIFWYFPDGIIKPLFHPQAVGNSFEFPAMTKPLEKVKADLIVLKGVDYKTEGSHEGGAAYALTGMPQNRAGLSLDTLLAQSYGANAPFPVLRLGVGANFQRNGSVSFYAPGIPSVIEDHPSQAFYGLFGQSQTPIDPATQAKILRGEKSLLDLAKSQLQSIQLSLNEKEKQKLAVHLESLRELERRVQSSVPIDSERLPTCTQKVDMRGLVFPEQETSYPPMIHRNELYATIGDIMSDIALEALSCGLTKVLYFQWSHPVSPTQFNFPSSPGIAKGHHDISHYGGDAESSYARDFVACQAWYMERLANFIERLGAISTGSKSLLYYTSLMAFTEIADANLHDFTNAGLILAGQAGGLWKTGRCLDLKGTSHNQVLVSMQQSLGLTGDTVGDPRLGRGPAFS